MPLNVGEQFRVFFGVCIMGCTFFVWEMGLLSVDNEGIIAAPPSSFLLPMYVRTSKTSDSPLFAPQTPLITASTAKEKGERAHKKLFYTYPLYSRRRRTFPPPYLFPISIYPSPASAGGRERK